MVTLNSEIRDGISDSRETFYARRSREIEAIPHPTDRQQLFAKLANQFLQNPDSLTATEIDELAALEVEERGAIRTAAIKRVALKMLAEKQEE